MTEFCPPAEAAVKCFFLGPKAENAQFLSAELSYVLNRWFDWRKSKFPLDGGAIPEVERSSAEFLQQQQFFHEKIEVVLSRFEKEIPKFSPRYIGHMFSEFSMPALLGHVITLLHNPNNVSRESSYVGVEFEREAIQFLGEMLSYPEAAMGHFTSGGTVANLEFLIRAKYRWQTWLGAAWQDKPTLMEASHAGWSLQPSTGVDLHGMSEIRLARKIEERFRVSFDGPVLLVPENKHYSWIKGANYLGLGREGLVTVALDRWGRMDIPSLKKRISECRKAQRPILGVVSVCGSTELGTIDPIFEVDEHLATLRNQEGFHVWHHVDAAYGGFFATLKDLEGAALSKDQLKNLGAMANVNSVTLDPHKLGYVPYASGAFICREPKDYFLDLFKAPYVQFDSELDRGLFTIEGSRSAAGAISTWLTAACIGFNSNGYGKLIDRTIRTCQQFEDGLRESGLPILFLNNPKTNILCFCIGSKGDSLSEINRRTNALYLALEKLNQEKETFFISKSVLSNNFEALIARVADEHKSPVDSADLIVLRLTMMNPFLLSKHTNVNYLQEFLTTLKSLMPA